MSNTELLTCTGKKPLPFMKYKWIFVVFSIGVAIMTAYALFGKGFNFGVDFVGGNKIVYKFKDSVTLTSLRDATATLGLDGIEITPFSGEDNSNAYVLKAKYIEGKDVPAQINAGLVSAFGQDKFEVLSQEIVGPKVGADLRRDALLSVFWACLLILVYIAVRFDALFAPGAIVALIHDVSFTAGFFVMFGKEFNLPILAALLTILGYSINDTIIIFDRIRDNLKHLPRGTALDKVIDISLTETLSRTIVTSFTVFLVAVMLFFIGGSVLHDFAFCMMVGVAFGTYSSIFIASPIYLGLAKWFPDRGIAGKKQMA